MVKLRHPLEATRVVEVARYANTSDCMILCASKYFLNATGRGTYCMYILGKISESDEFVFDYVDKIRGRKNCLETPGSVT